MKRILMGIASAVLALVVIDSAQAGDWGHGRGYTGHYDYVPGHYDRHRLHYDYAPGRYDYHRGPHRDYNSASPGYYSAPPVYSSPGYYAVPSYPVAPGYRHRSHCDY